MHKRFIQIGSLLGALSVITGAFGAHALKHLLPLQAMMAFETGVRYQFYHTVALLLTGILYKEYGNKQMRYAGAFFITGICLFSGSLYLITFLQAKGFSYPSVIGLITPLGGIALIAGWLLLALSVTLRK